MTTAERARQTGFAFLNDALQTQFEFAPFVPAIRTATPPTPAPVNTVLPVISGTPAVGQTLTTTDGTWTESPTGFTYLWKHGDGSTAAATATNQTYVVGVDDTGFTMKVTVTATNMGGSTPATSLPTSTVPWTPESLGASLTDDWIPGVRMYQDSGATTPVTAADQTVASWVGRNGTKLTTTGGAMKCKSVNGILSPVSISDAESAWVLPVDLETDQRDFTAWLFIQSGSGWEGGFLGLGDDRGCELSTFHDIRVRTFNATGGQRISELATLASPMVLSLDGSALTLGIRLNASSFDAAPALPVGTIMGGFIGAINSSGTAAELNACVYLGLSLTKTLDGTNRGLMQTYFNSRVPIASDTAPAKNIVALDDSNTAGTGAGGVNWQYYYAWNGLGTTRVVSSAKSGQFFSAGAVPVNGVTNTTQIDLEYRAGAGNNVIAILDTNDFTSLSAADALANREAWAADRRLAGWKVCQPYMPHRVAPYGSAVAYNLVIDAFNTLLLSSTAFDYRPDLYTAFGGASPPAGTFAADGVHWTAATQLNRVYATLSAEF